MRDHEPELATMKNELSGAGIVCLRDEPLSRHTTLGVGGRCDLLVQPVEAEQMARVYRLANELSLPTRVLGAGSNLLVDEQGVRGVVVHTARMNHFKIGDSGQVHADAGVHFPTLVKASVNAGLRGLEAGVGIPGSLGGVVTMNAGTYDFSIGPMVDSVRVVSTDRLTPVDRELERGRFEFRYRESSFGSEWSLASAEIQLEADEVAAIKQDMARHTAYRKQTQPVGVRSAGCIFKNPEGDSAGRLIDELSLKGLSVGSAKVSTAHANFIVHDGTASASDVLRLIDEIRERVFRRTEIVLEHEVMVWN